WPPSLFLSLFQDAAPTALHTLSLHDALPISSCIVPEGRLEMTGETPPHGQQFLQGKFLERRVFFKKCIQIVNICLKVAVEKFSLDRKSTRLNSSHVSISYAVFCLKKKKKILT